MNSNDMQENQLPDQAVSGAPPEQAGRPAATAVVRCKACDTDVVPNPNRHCPECGGFLPGNKAAEVHGGRAALSMSDLEWRRDLIERLVAERGGRDRVSAITKVRIADYATAATQLRNVSKRLNAEGPVTAAGRRKSLVDIYNVFSSRVERLGADLGDAAVSGDRARRRLDGTSFDELIDHAETLLARVREGRTPGD